MLTDGRTDDGRKVITIAHPEQSSGELIKQDLSNTSISSLSILYKSNFILMAMSLGTNAVVVRRVQCSITLCFHTK